MRKMLSNHVNDGKAEAPTSVEETKSHNDVEKVPTNNEMKYTKQHVPTKFCTWKFQVSVGLRCEG